MTCECNHLYPITLYTTSITYNSTSGNLVITVPTIDLANMTNLQKLNIILCQAIPSTGSAPAPVVLSDGTNSLTILVVTGNYLRADEIKSGRCYKMIYGNDPQHLSLLYRVPRTCYRVATTTPATTTEDDTTQE